MLVIYKKQNSTLIRGHTPSAKPGKLERFDTSYEKNGVSNIFLNFEPLTGKRYVNVAERRTRMDWAKHIRELVEVYPMLKKLNWLLII